MQDSITSDYLFTRLNQVEQDYKKVVRLNLLVWMSIVCIGALYVFRLVAKIQENNLYWFLIIIPFLFFLVLIIFYPNKVYKYTHYGLVDEVFYVQKGWLFKKRTAVAQNRIQHIDVEQGPFLRKYNLAQLILHTAGVKEADITISGLRYTDAIATRDYLLQLNKERLTSSQAHVNYHEDPEPSNTHRPLVPTENSIATSVLSLREGRGNQAQDAFSEDE